MILGMRISVTERQPDEFLHELDRALRFARARIGPDVTAQRLLILTAVYFNEGLSQRELLKHLDTTSITALSRNGRTFMRQWLRATQKA